MVYVSVHSSFELACKYALSCFRMDSDYYMYVPNGGDVLRCMTGVSNGKCKGIKMYEDLFARVTEHIVDAELE